MKALLALCEKGGPVMIAIIALSVVLYSRCFLLLMTLRQSRRQLDQMLPQPEGPAASRRLQDGIYEAFRQQRVALGAMIAAAPLLGLLGTVSGLVRTFDSLSSQAGQNSMENLADGISEVLVATESGLVVAIPALLLVYVAHREMRKQLQTLNRMGATPE
ncbi:MAG: MotA/TolQ/ExbB proton channel family protein [Opitutaceae bacterium]|nr:MotA/TolQ/ExbB proton channel family protein [Opitutaceae bacterium]